MVKLIIYEDNTVLQETLQILFNQHDEINLLHIANNCETIKKDIENYKPDVILMDIDMPGIGGIEGLQMAKQINDKVQIIMFTVYEDDNKLFTCLMAGANGYLLKNSSATEIVDAVYNVNNGGSPMSPSIARKVLTVFNTQKSIIPQNLSEREIEILQLLSDGFPAKAIAHSLGISIETVKTHLKNIYQKMHVASGTQAVAKALRLKILR